MDSFTSSDYKKVFLSRVPLKHDEAKIRSSAETKFGDVVEEVVLVRDEDIDNRNSNNDDGLSLSLSQKKGPHLGYGYLTFKSLEDKEAAMKIGTFNANPNSKKKRNIHMREIERNERPRGDARDDDAALASYTSNVTGDTAVSPIDAKPTKLPPQTENRSVCYLWQKFSCPHHEQCKFSHVGPGGCVAKAGEGKQKKCLQWWTKGECSKRDTCPYAHDEETKGKGRRKRVKGDVATRTPSDQPKLCFTYLKKGKCRKGDNCPYAHDADARAASEATKANKKRKREEEVGAEKAASVPRPEGCVTLKVRVAGEEVKRSVVEKGLKEIMVTGVKKVKSTDDGVFTVSFKSESECGDAYVIAANAHAYEFGRRISVAYC